MRKRFILSIGLNFVVCGALLWLWLRPERLESAARGADEVRGAPAAAVLLARPPGEVATFDWRQVESPDYRVYLANLRAVGCPEQTVRDIILADVGALYDERERELRSRQPAFEFWRGDAQGAWSARVGELRSALKALQQEKRDVIAQLLGPDVAATLREEGEEAVEALDGRLGFLAEKDQRRVTEMERQFRSRTAEILLAASVDDPMFKDQDPFEAIASLRQEHEAALVELLGMEGKEGYDLRASPTAERLRRQLEGFQPTELEFREILRRQKAVDDVFGLRLELFGISAEQREARERMAEELRSALGEARYLEYERAMEGGPSAP